MAVGDGVDRHVSKRVDYAKRALEGEMQLMSYYNGTTQCTESV